MAKSIKKNRNLKTTALKPDGTVAGGQSKLCYLVVVYDMANEEKVWGPDTVLATSVEMAKAEIPMSVPDTYKFFINKV